MVQMYPSRTQAKAAMDSGEWTLSGGGEILKARGTWVSCGILGLFLLS